MFDTDLFDPVQFKLLSPKTQENLTTEIFISGRENFVAGHIEYGQMKLRIKNEQVSVNPV